MAREYIKSFRDWLAGNTAITAEEVGEDRSFKITLEEWSELRCELDLNGKDRGSRYDLHAEDTKDTDTQHQHKGTFKEISGLRKDPDLQVGFKRRGEGGLVSYKIKLVMEVGFSEKYPFLVQHAKLWLEGKRGVSLAIIVGFEEFPVYRSPLGKLGYEDVERLYKQYQGFKSLPNEPDFPFTAIGDFGPMTYEGLTWIGRITAFMETWIRDPVTGSAILNGNRISLLPPAELPQLKYSLSDFIDTPPDKDIPISFDWDMFREELMTSTFETACGRYEAAMVEYGKKKREEEEEGEEEEKKARDEEEFPDGEGFLSRGGLID
ncbi:hypothetical protein GP486_007227 [Trichoglossum hirsutum]|uniref:Uncharacterized protein n=1 Tax=Trichoglossum hirsutum TaxID=265104 RepID=A0A9P8IHS6_9PEZI|nr:hypothetical protein GP486_007227 [Trichoglossum hirsutum]